MSNYCVTFRISAQTANGRTYADRYEGFITDLREEGIGFWDATTSFFFVESRLNTSDFGARAVRHLNPQYDIAVIFDPEDMSAVYFGAVKDVDILESFLPRIKKAA